MKQVPGVTFSPHRLLVLVCAGVLLGIYDGSCNQCIGDPKHLMFSAVVESKIRQENNKYFFN